MTPENTDCGLPPTPSASLMAPDAMFRHLVECAVQGIGWADLNGNVVYMNPALRRMLDLVPEAEVSGLDLRRFRPPEAEAVAGEMLRVVREQGRWSGELPLLSEQGRVIPTRHDIHLLRAADGTPIAIACAVTDLSQQKQLEQSLRDSKSKYRALVENIPQRVFYKDCQSRYLAVNRHYANDKGISPQDVVGQDDYALTPRYLADKYRADDLRIIASGQAEEYDELHDQAGKQFTVHTIKTPVRDENGQVIGICGIYWDVTEQRAAYERVEMLQRVVDFSSQPIGWADLDGKARYFNLVLRRMLGVSEAADVSRYRVDDFYSDAQLQILRDRVRSEVMEQGYWHGEFDINALDGRVIPTLHSVFLIRDSADQPIALANILTDLSAQKRIEAELRAERNFTGAVLDNARALLLVLDREGRIRRFNRACETISGYSFAEVEGRFPWDFLLLPEERDTVREQAFLALGNDPETLASSNTNHWLDKHGGKHLLEWHRASLLDDQGQLEYLVAIGIDVTERKKADQALRDSERLLRTVIDEISDPLLLKDYKGDFLLCNQAVARLYNTTPEAMIGKHDGDFGVPREMAESFRQNVLEIMARGESQIVFEDSRDAVSGAIRHFKSVKKPFKDNEGRNQILVVAQDITDVIRAQQQVAESERRMQEVMEITREGIWDWNVATGRVIHNTQWYETLRLAESEVVNSADAFAELIHPADKEQVWQRLDAMLKGGGDYYSEHRLVRRDGQTIWVQDRGRIVERDPQGHPLRVVGSFSDITERRQAEQDLKHHRSHLEVLVRERTAEVEKEGNRNAMIVNTALDGFFTASLDGQLLDCNQIYCRMLGYTREELLQLSVLDIEAAETPEEIAAHMRALFESGHDRFDTCHRHKSGRPIDVELNVTVALIGDERLFFAFVHDITDRKKGESALIRARDEAERANRAKSEFLSRMSHELRTPLNAIIGFGQLLEHEKLPGVQADNVQEVLHAGRHLLELINEVLDLARIESGKFMTNLDAVALMPLIADSINLIRPQAAARGIRIEVAGMGCNEQVLADRTRLKQVVLNLLSNAVKYNRPQGELGIDCRRLGDAVQIRVSDTGAGLSAEQQSRLFVPFERLDAEKTAVEGTGIGLALSKRLVELMQGEIGVESAPGAGSTFWVRLPLVGLPPAGAQAEASSCPAGLQEGLEEPPACRHQFDILCIEDNPANLRLVERILSSRPDIRLLSASAPGLGLELAQAHHPALILLDINLPGMDGYEVLRRLQADAATRDIPVLAISANAMPEDLARGRAAGFVDYLTKPLDIGRFLAAVDTHLADKRGAHD